MNTLKLFTILFCLILSELSTAQGYRGTILNSQRQPIEFVNVVAFEEDNDSFINGTITNKKGEFNIEILTEKPFYFKISFIGFKSIVIPANKNNLGIIILENNEILLKEVQITHKKPIVEQKNDKIVFNVGSLLTKGESCVELLKKAPVIWVNNSNQILIEQEPAVIQINGRTINLRGVDLSSYLSSINSENISKIEIQPNISSDLDANSKGGVVNIIIKKRPLGFNGTVQSYYRYYDDDIHTFYVGIPLNYGSKRWNIYSSYNYKNGKSGGDYISSYNILNNKRNMSNSGDFTNDFEEHKYKVGGTFQINKKQDLGIEFYGVNNIGDLLSKECVLINKDNDLIVKGLHNSKSDNIKRINDLNFNYHLKIDSLGSNLKVIIDYLSHNFKRTSDNYSVYELGAENNTESQIYNYKTDSYFGQLDLKKAISEKFAISLGTKYTILNRENKIRVKGGVIDNYRHSLNIFNYEENIVAGYFSSNYSWGNNNFIKIGLRMEHTSFYGKDKASDIDNSKKYYSWFPSFYYSKKKNKNTFSFSYSRTLWRPPLEVMSIREVKQNDFKYDIGNPYLMPEFSNQYKFMMVNEKGHIFTTYFNNTSDAIHGTWRIEEDSLAIHQNKNFGNRKKYGVTYGFSKQIKPWWYFKIQGELFHKRFRNKDYSLKKTTLFFYSNCDFKINKTTLLNISGNYMSPFLSSNSVNSENYNIDVMISKKFFKGHLDIRFYVHDILNSHRNKIEASYNNFNFNFYNKPYSRSFTFLLRYTFSNKKSIRKEKNKSNNNDIQNRL